MTPRGKMWAGFALLLVVPAVGPAAPALPPPVTGEVVTLPPLMVEWKNAPLKWRYLAFPGFELLTVCDDAQAVAFAERNHRLAELLRALVADRFLLKSTVPETHVLFNEETGRARSQEVIADMVRAEGLKVAADGNVQTGRDIELPDVGLTIGMLRTVHLQPKQIVFLPNLRLDDRDSLAVFSILPRRSALLTFGYAPDRLQVLLEARAPALPPWFVAGVLELFRQTQFGQDEVTLQPFRWQDEAESRALARDPGRPRVLLPMAQVFAGRRPAPGAKTTDAATLWEAQCALFVRWTLADPGGARRAALEKFVDRLESEAPTEALFRECFGLGWAEMRDRLSDYLPVAVSRRLELIAPPTVRLPRLNPRAATPLEIARLRGNWERREIAYVRARYPTLADSYLFKARATLHRAYDAGERDPRLLAELGLTELEADPAEARRFLEAAMAGGMRRPRAAYELARLRYAALPAGNSPLTAAEAATVFEPLQAALALDPPLPECYVLLATVWSRNQDLPPVADLQQLNEGARLFPAASLYVLRVISFNVSANDLVAARRIAALGELHATDASMRERFTRLRAELAAAAP